MLNAEHEIEHETYKTWASSGPFLVWLVIRQNESFIPGGSFWRLTPVH